MPSCLTSHQLGVVVTPGVQVEMNPGSSAGVIIWLQAALDDETLTLKHGGPHTHLTARAQADALPVALTNEQWMATGPAHTFRQHIPWVPSWSR
jgi:hypothetical protein